MALREKVKFGKVLLQGAKLGASTLVLLEDLQGMALLATSTDNPPSGVAGYAKGCLLLVNKAHVNIVWMNVGSRTSCSFSAVQFA